MVHVIAEITLEPGRREEFLEAFRSLLPLVRAEKGCIEYGPTVDVDAGVAAVEAPREDVVTVVERWESLESLRAHLEAPHMRDYRDRVKHLVSSTTVRVTQPV